MSRLAFLVYRHFLMPLAWVLIQLYAWVKTGKIREMVKDKNSHFFHFHNTNEKELRTKKPFWIHAASGEIEYARPVIRLLKKEFPQTPILVTYTSPSAKKILQSIPEIDAWGALPWEFPWLCSEFLIRFAPRAWLVARTDVWPEMSFAVKKYQIPALLFSATFAENSSRLKGLSRYLTQFSLENLNEIFVVSQQDQKNLSLLNIETPIKVTGDTRYDQVFYRLENPKPVKESLRPPMNQITLVCGSTWPEDERVILPAIAKAKIKTILAPHEIHPEHLQKIQQSLQNQGLSYSLYSKSNEWNSDVLVLDQIGILAEIYTWGNLGFVGGSFRKQVHSVMEPLAAGLPVLVGPAHRNNREAVLGQGEVYSFGTLVSCVHDSQEFAHILNQFLSHFETKKIKDEIRLQIKKNVGSSNTVLDWAKKVT